MTDSVRRGELLDVPDWALDGHTRRGRAIGRGEEFLQREGRMIANHGAIDGDPWAQRWRTGHESQDPVGAAVPAGDLLRSGGRDVHGDRVVA